jgi:biopolymer transport protein ExbD
MKIIAKNLSWITVFCVNLLVAQPKQNIELPEGGKDMNVQVGTQLYSLYVTENLEIYNDDTLLEYFEDISFNFLDQKNKAITENLLQNFILYADKKVPYQLIDLIKQEVSRVKNNIHYKTGNLEDLETVNKLLEYNPYNYRELKSITALATQIKESNNAETEMVSVAFMNMPPPPPPSLVEYLYWKDKSTVLEGLALFNTYTYITFKGSTILDSEGNVLNEKTLKQILPDKGLVFIRFDKKLLYGDYIKSTLLLDKVRKELNEDSQLQFRPFEASAELEVHFQNLEISFKK